MKAICWKPNMPIVISWLTMIVLLGFLSTNAISYPTVDSKSPDNYWSWVPVNTNISIQFSESMDTASVEDSFSMEDDYENEIEGSFYWSETDYPDDTVTFIPHDTLKYGTHYWFGFTGRSTTGEGLDGTLEWYDVTFTTKHSYADATPPTVHFVYPYDGMEDVSNTPRIFCHFNEAMDPGTINDTNIILEGPGIDPGDYGVWYGLEEGWVSIWKNTPFEYDETYTVTIKKDVKDARGNRLENEYDWSFTTTDTLDETPPTVTQTIPANSDTNVAINPWIWACFSEPMDVGSSLTPGNITLYDNDLPGYVDISARWREWNAAEIRPMADLEYGHSYTVTVTTGVQDRAGNNLDSEHSWSFTTVSAEGNSDPVIHCGPEIDQQDGIRDSSGTGVWLEVYASDSDPGDETLDVAANGWTLSLESESPQYGRYIFESSVDEGLDPGTNTLTFLIRDNHTPAPNEVTFEQDIYIFNDYPRLTYPENEATEVSTTPTLQWDSNGINGAFMYQISVLDGPDPDTDTRIWRGYQAADGSTSYSVTIPADKALAPNTTYYWEVMCLNKDENGVARSDVWEFTTGGTDWPAPSFEWIMVRGDKDTFGTKVGVFGAKVVGPSPADIRELTVSRDAGGYFYKFTQDDITYHFQQGMFYLHLQFGQVPDDGTYTFTLEDRKGRKVTQPKSFAFNDTLPIIDPLTITPADSTYVNTTTPTFSWDLVEGDYYSRINILCWNYEAAVYTSPLTKDTAVTVPPGILAPDTPYKWRVEVLDGPTWDVINNCSETDWMRFSTGPYPYTIDLSWGNVARLNYYYGAQLGQAKTLGTRVIGPLPNDVSELRVTGTGYSYDFTEGDFVYILGSGVPNYFHPELGPPPDGLYTFKVSDVYGGSKTYSTNFTFSETPIPIAHRNTFLPGNNAYLTTITPTLSWDAVSESESSLYYYNVGIFDWKTNRTYYISPTSADTCVTIPAGILKPDSSYMWWVAVSDGFGNISSSGLSCFTILSASYLDTDGDGIVDLVDTEPYNPSDNFSFGTTTGLITDRGNQVLTIAAKSDPDGVRITADPSGGTEAAEVSVCEGSSTLTLDAGDEVVITCSSVDINVIIGTVKITFFADDGTVATTSLDAGNGLAFEPTTFTFTAPSTNPDVIVVLVEDLEYSITPGESKQRLVDIKPGSYPNRINLDSKGVVPVAVLTSEDLDATTVDSGTVKFAGAVPISSTLKDVDGDGDIDILFHFNTQDLKKLDEESTEATLTGKTYGRQKIKGTDTVNIVSK